MTPGRVHIYCGDGKGKTTAALGLALRAAGSGKRVLLLQFFKDGKSSEFSALEAVKGIEVIPQTRRFGFYAAGSLVLCAASLADGSAYLSSLLLYAGGALTLTGFLLLRIANGLEKETNDGTIVGPVE